MARDDLKTRLREILVRHGWTPSPLADDLALDDVIEEVLRATAADVARKAMEWWRSRKADDQ
ncbi:MAG TPA: hypothetical protein VMV18_11445 [bacterium]|nr:hypothetical protein [bacterium]